MASGKFMLKTYTRNEEKDPDNNKALIPKIPEQNKWSYSVSGSWVQHGYIHGTFLKWPKVEMETSVWSPRIGGDEVGGRCLELSVAVGVECKAWW